MEEQKIRCHKFCQKEPTLKKITEEINRAQDQGKLKMAERLKDEVETLLACENYDPKSLECQSCRLISQTRKKTAEVIVKVLSSLS